MYVKGGISVRYKVQQTVCGTATAWQLQRNQLKTDSGRAKARPGRSTQSGGCIQFNEVSVNMHDLSLVPPPKSTPLSPTQ